MASTSRPSIPLEVIRIENVDPTWRHILLRHLTSPAPRFHLTDYTTLNNIPVEDIAPLPPELATDGQLTGDLLCLLLRNHVDLAFFRPGKTLFLAGYERHLPEASLAELRTQLLQEITTIEHTAGLHPDWDWPPALLIPLHEFYQATITSPLDPANIRASYQKLHDHITTHRLKGFYFEPLAQRLEQLAREATS